jgi:signal transduction histidine kinase
LGVGVLDKFDQVKKLFSYNAMPATFSIYDAALYDLNTVLVATSEGLYLYNLRSNTIKLIYKDPIGAHFRTIYNYKNYFLIGTYGGGIYVLQNGVIKPLVLDKNNYLKFSHCFIPNDKDVWISTNKGIIKSSFESLISNFSNQKLIPNYKYYGKQEGIDILEMNGGCTPCAIKMANGKISVPGIDGLIQFNPNALPTIKIVPNVYVDKYKFDDLLIEEADFNRAPISHKIDVVQLILGISGMISEENIELEYDIDGKETWRKIPVKNPVIFIENPRAGAHTLTIRWKNTDASGWDYKKVSYSIAYPWYAHPYMYFGYLLITVGLILLYVKIKTIIYQRRQRELETEVSAKTKNLQDINSYLTERNQAKDQVIAIMNHDILTPLKYLHITAANLENNLKGTESAKPIGQIKETTKELEYLTSNLLSWVKFDTINQLDQKQTIDVKLLIDSIIDFILPFKQSDKVIIVNNVPEGTVIYGWHDPMRVLVYNLLMNSIKSTTKGNIVISSETVSNKFVLSVSDEGSGMSQAMVDYLLTGVKSKEQFISPKYKKGNGVGYQIIRNLVKLIFVEMQISSKINEGTVVKIIIQQP